MSDDTTQNSSADYDPESDPDTDATMTAPDEGRPDRSDTSDEPPAQQPQQADAEVLESQEEERPAAE